MGAQARPAGRVRRHKFSPVPQTGLIADVHGVDAVAESPETAVKVATATYVHQHVGEFFRDLMAGRTVQVTTAKGKPYVRVKAVQDA